MRETRLCLGLSDSESVELTEALKHYREHVLDELHLASHYGNPQNLAHWQAKAHDLQQLIEKVHGAYAGAEFPTRANRLGETSRWDLLEACS